MRMSRQFDENIEAIDPLETMPPAKKSMVIFFLVDTSKSMEGSKLESLNRKFQISKDKYQIVFAQDFC